MSACAPRLNPFDWISVASWPNNSSVWNPALNFVGSYGLSSTSASALSMKRFCRRSYRRPTIAVSPMLRPEYEYDPSAKPVSLNPANEVSRWFTVAGAGGGSAFLLVVRRDGGDRGRVDLPGPDPDHALQRLHEDLPVTHLAGPCGREDRLDRRLHERLRHGHLEPHLLAELEHDGPATVVLLQLALAAVPAHATDGDARDAGAEQRRLHLRQPVGAYHCADEFHCHPSQEALVVLGRLRLGLELSDAVGGGGRLAENDRRRHFRRVGVSERAHLR